MTTKTYQIEVLAKPSYLDMTRTLRPIVAKIDWASELEEVLGLSDKGRADPKLDNVNYLNSGKSRVYVATYDGEPLILQVTEIKN